MADDYPWLSPTGVMMNYRLPQIIHYFFWKKSKNSSKKKRKYPVHVSLKFDLIPPPKILFPSHKICNDPYITSHHPGRDRRFPNRWTPNWTYPVVELPKRQQWRPKTIEPNLSVQPCSVPPKKETPKIVLATWFLMGVFWWDFLVVFFAPPKKTRFFRVFGGEGRWFLVGWLVKRFQSPKPHIPKQRQRTNQPTNWSLRRGKYLIDAPSGYITGIKLGCKIPYLVSHGCWRKLDGTGTQASRL